MELAGRRPDLKLIVMGAGTPLEAVLRSFPEHVHGRIEYVPQAAAEVYAERMLGAAVYVVPSLFEGTPQTLMEAMATGLPSVGNRDLWYERRHQRWHKRATNPAP